MKVLKLEFIEHDLNVCLARCGLPYQMVPKQNSSANKKIRASACFDAHYYTKSTMKKIGDRYARDIEIFGYQC